MRYSFDIIDDAIVYVKSYNYLDDERFARDYITYHMEMRSRNRIIQDLTTKGISKDTAMPILEELYQQANESSDLDIEQEQIRRLLDKKH